MSTRPQSSIPRRSFNSSCSRCVRLSARYLSASSDSCVGGLTASRSASRINSDLLAYPRSFQTSSICVSSDCGTLTLIFSILPSLSVLIYCDTSVSYESLLLTHWTVVDQIETSIGSETLLFGEIQNNSAAVDAERRIRRGRRLG